MRTMGGRPVLLQRFPEGAGGPSFFQKRVPKNKPSWLQTTVVATPNGTTSEALVAADIDHVLWAVNLGCLGFHVWPYLTEAGVTGYPKTTGNRGLHVYVRLEPRWDSYQVRSSAVAIALARKQPRNCARTRICVYCSVTHFKCATSSPTHRAATSLAFLCLKTSV